MFFLARRRNRVTHTADSPRFVSAPEYSKNSPPRHFAMRNFYIFYSTVPTDTISPLVDAYFDSIEYVEPTVIVLFDSV